MLISNRRLKRDFAETGREERGRGGWTSLLFKKSSRTGAGIVLHIDRRDTGALSRRRSISGLDPISIDGTSGLALRTFYYANNGCDRPKKRKFRCACAVGVQVEPPICFPSPLGFGIQDGGSQGPNEGRNPFRVAETESKYVKRRVGYCDGH